MPFALILIGILLFVAAYHNNVAALSTQIRSDLIGSKGFLIWVVAIFIIGSLGYVQVLRGVSRAFLVLIILVIFLSNKGVFNTLVQTLGLEGDGTGEPLKTTEPTKPTEPTTPTTPAEGSSSP